MKKATMKNVNFLLVFLLVIMTVDLGAVTTFAAGDEFEAHGINAFSVITIGDADDTDDVAALRNALTNGERGRTIRLMKDIFIEEDWIPIDIENGNNFILDGNGFVVSLGVSHNLNQSHFNAGLIGSVNASNITIMDLGVISRGISASSNNNTDAFYVLYVGGLIGVAARESTVRIERSFVLGDVTAIREGPSGGIRRDGFTNAGGLVGEIHLGNVTITDSYYNGNVNAIVTSSTGNTSNATARAGGLVGHLSVGTLNISNSYATGSVAATANASNIGSSFGIGTARAGGIIGSVSTGTLGGNETTVFRANSVSGSTSPNSNNPPPNEWGRHVSPAETLQNIEALPSFFEPLRNAGMINPLNENGTTALEINGGFPILPQFHAARGIELINPNLVFENFSSVETLQGVLTPSPVGTYDKIILNGAQVRFGDALGNTQTIRAVNKSDFFTEVRPMQGVSPENYIFSARTSDINIGGTIRKQETFGTASIGQHAVTFNLNGGIANGSSENITQRFNPGAIIGIENVPIPTLANRKFNGWELTSPIIQTVILSREEAGARIVFSPLTFTAEWEPIPHNVTFDLNGGNVGGSFTVPIREINQGSSVGEPPVPTLANHNFLGWRQTLPTEEETLLSHDVLTWHPVSYDVTYTAQWQQITHDITFDLNGGKINDSTEIVLVINQNEQIGITNIPAPVLEGHVLNGWRFPELSPSAPNLTSEQISAHIITAPMTFTAQWEQAPPVTVTFNFNGGTRTGGGAISQTISYNGTAIAPTVSRGGFVFNGWDRSFNNVTSNITVTAQWLRIGAVSSGGTGNVTSADVVFLARSVANHEGFALADNRIGNLRGLDRTPNSNDITMLLRWLVGHDLEYLISQTALQ